MADDPDNSGGTDEGGAFDRANYKFLRRSELAILRKQSDRYPIQPAERQEAVDKVMDTLRNSEAERSVLGAANTLVSMDRVNLEEFKVALAAEKMNSEIINPPAAPSQTININFVNATVDDLVNAIKAGHMVPKEAVRRLTYEEKLELHKRVIG